MFRSRPWSRPRIAAGIALVGLTIITSPALSGDGFTPAVTLNTTPDDRELHLTDLGAKGDELAVTWWESGESWRAFVRTSADGGATFAPRRRLNPPGLSDRAAGNHDPAIDVCGHWWWAVSQLNREPEDHILLFSIVLNARPISGPGSQMEVLKGAGDRWEVSNPDIACVGNRRWIAAWTEFDLSGIPDSEPRARVMLRPTFGGGPDYSFGLGRVDVGDGLSVAASRSTAYAAWFKDEHLRFRRFSVGPGPDSLVTAHPPVTLFDALDGHDPVLAADGPDVALAYSRGEDLWVRFSADSGMTFGDEERLLDLDPGHTTRATSIDMRGDRVVIEADAGGDRYRLDSPDLGVSWAVIPVPGGVRFGAFMRLGGSHLLAESWRSGPNVRFHRET
jgi:hypothetical protein